MHNEETLEAAKRVRAHLRFCLILCVTGFSTPLLFRWDTPAFVRFQHHYFSFIPLWLSFSVHSPFCEIRLNGDEVAR